jgi:hypothetical protein
MGFFSIHPVLWQALCRTILENLRKVVSVKPMQSPFAQAGIDAGQSVRLEQAHRPPVPSVCLNNTTKLCCLRRSHRIVAAVAPVKA